jgi:hypothetical protein
VLMLSFNFYVHIWFGLLIVLSMIVSATSALLLIPALIKLHPPRFLKTSVRNGDVAAKMPLQLAPAQQVVTNPGMTSFQGKLGLAGFAVASGLFLGLLTAPGEVGAQEPAADPLMEKNYQATRVDSSISQASFRLVSASGQERTRSMFGASKLAAHDGNANRRVIRFLSPSDVRNTTTLLIENPGKDDEIWVYLPALKKARRLASNNKKSSFVGTDLSFGDLVGHKAKDWHHKILRQDNLAGVPVYVVESVPKTPEIAADSGYSKRTSWVAKDNHVSLKIEFLDANGALLKTLENSQITLVDAAQKKFQPLMIQVANHQTGHATYLKFDKFEANKPVAESYFAPAYLEKEE